MSDEVERVVARVRNLMILVVGVVARGMLRRTVLVIIAVACEGLLVSSAVKYLGVGTNEWDPRLM